MHDVELKIKKEDWLFIIGVGISFGALLSSVSYSLFEMESVDGAIFGALIGLCISMLSLIFITLSNSYVLPSIAHGYWQIIAMFFSFLSGFFGTLAAVRIGFLLQIQILPAFAQKSLIASVAIGVATYIIGVLMHRFVKMRNENERAEELLLKSRIGSLETQLNPHFLFNSINSIAELIYKDQSKAEEALLGISSFLRSVMKEASLITIKEELSNIEKYIALENIRFDGKIRVTIYCDGQIQNSLVPKFSIGLIVENAIKHGFDRQKTLNIAINVIKKDKIIEISVENDGLPIKNRDFGIGLTNLSERLKYLSGGSVETGYEGKQEYIIKLKERYEDINS